MPKDAEFCAECGAPLTDAPGVGGSDQEVYPELAKANVLRMRKEFKQAEDICLSILRRFPNNASANTLLGDIAAEKGELEQSAEWYELSLDIVPDSKEVKAKLEAVRAQLAEQETKTAVETLGIPERKAPIGLYAMIGVIVGAFLIAAAVIASRRPPEAKPDPNKPLIVGNNEPAKPAEPIKQDEPEEVVYREDEALGAALAEAAALGNRTLVVSVAQPGGEVRITLHAVGADGEWPIRVKLVSEAFKRQADADKVEMRYFLPGNPTAETHIVTRSSFEKTQAADFDQTNLALVVETLFGHRLPAPEPAQPSTGTTAPPLGEGPGGDGTSDVPNTTGSSDAAGSGS